jgi:excisionase family DNA binding protein
MTVKEMAEYLRVHPCTIYRLLRRQAMPGFKIGSDWRFNVETIDVWRLSSTAEVDTAVKRRAAISRGKSAHRRGQAIGLRRIS